MFQNLFNNGACKLSEFRATVTFLPSFTPSIIPSHFFFVPVSGYWAFCLYKQLKYDYKNSRDLPKSFGCITLPSAKKTAHKKKLCFPAFSNFLPWQTMKKRIIKFVLGGSFHVEFFSSKQKVYFKRDNIFFIHINLNNSFNVKLWRVIFYYSML